MWRGTNNRPLQRWLPVATSLVKAVIKGLALSPRRPSSRSDLLASFHSYSTWCFLNFSSQPQLLFQQQRLPSSEMPTVSRMVVPSCLETCRLPMCPMTSGGARRAWPMGFKAFPIPSRWWLLRLRQQLRRHEPGLCPDEEGLWCDNYSHVLSCMHTRVCIRRGPWGGGGK